MAAKEKAAEGNEAPKVYSAAELAQILGQQLVEHRELIVADLRLEIKDLVAEAVAEMPNATWQVSPVGAEFDEAPAFSAADLELIEAACAAYGITAQHLLGSNIDRSSGEAVLVTNGGAKVRYQAGQTVTKLPEIRITGINPNPKRRQLTGARK